MSEFARRLKAWRTACGQSQLELALETGVSPKHVSFLETGRSRPSRDMVERLSEALELPLHARNQLLTVAGFAAKYNDHAWDDDEMGPVRRAVAWQLEKHLPYPGLAVDRLWTIRDANLAAHRLFGAMGMGPGDSLLDLLVSDTLPQVVENWDEVAHYAVVRLRTETSRYGRHPKVDRVLEHLAAFDRAPHGSTGPVMSTVLAWSGQRLAMFATLSHFSTAQTLLLDHLKLELYFPLDDATEAAFTKLGR